MLEPVEHNARVKSAISVVVLVGIDFPHEFFKEDISTYRGPFRGKNEIGELSFQTVRVQTTMSAPLAIVSPSDGISSVYTLICPKQGLPLWVKAEK